MILGHTSDEYWSCDKCTSLQVEIEVWFKLDSRLPYEDFDTSKAYCRECGSDTVVVVREYEDTLRDGDKW